ncbi:MAG: phosphocholine cytidylyltransferase family protein [Gammaproteobacteria bacterium]|nr:phosphocholine cytidylyltransferase family protein [Gammaproteobacteria bacterium]
MDAVILAAGMGSRIREMHDLPKGFICLGDQPIIVESIQKLKACGIRKILIVTGYASEYYDDLAKNIDGISTVHNPNYQCSGSLYSLYCAKDWVRNDFLILESDIIYEKKAIELLINNHDNNVILLSGETQSSDEVYVEALDKKLIKMSKQKNQLNEHKIYGEFVGINKMAYLDYQKLVLQLDENPAILKSGHYEEQGFVSMTKNVDVFCLKENNLLWCEIDNRFQYERAKALYLKIQKRSQQAGCFKSTETLPAGCV